MLRTFSGGLTWVLVVFSKGGASWREGGEGEELSLSLPSLKLTLSGETGESEVVMVVLEQVMTH